MHGGLHGLSSKILYFDCLLTGLSHIAHDSRCLKPGDSQEGRDRKDLCPDALEDFLSSSPFFISFP